MHKHVHITLFVQIGVGTALDADDVDLGTRRKSVLEHTARFHVTHLGTHESGTLAGFDVKEFYDSVNVVVEIDAQPIFNISCCCHKNKKN